MDTTQGELSLVVAGWPPVKTVDAPLVAADYPQARRVVRLLEATKAAIANTSWIPEADVAISLDLVLRCPAKPIAHAASILGGVADVLQNKTRDWTINLDHLAELDEVKLYDEDHQISQMAYREEMAEQVSYSVRIRKIARSRTARLPAITSKTVPVIKCPSPDAPLYEVETFGASYNGYIRLADSLESLNRVVAPVLDALNTGAPVPDWIGIDILRGTLFGCQREAHWTGYTEPELEQRMRTLIQAISQRLGADGQLLADDPP